MDMIPRKPLHTYSSNTEGPNPSPESQHPPAALRWRAQAACKGMTAGVFVWSPDNRKSAAKLAAEAQAFRVCARCAVIKECGAYADSNAAQTVGIWAGKMYTGRAT